MAKSDEVTTVAMLRDAKKRELQVAISNAQMPERVRDMIVARRRTISELTGTIAKLEHECNDLQRSLDDSPGVIARIHDELNALNQRLRGAQNADKIAKLLQLAADLAKLEEEVQS